MSNVQREAKKLDAGISRLDEKFKEPQRVGAEGADAQGPSEFPAQYTSSDAYDNSIAIKKTLAADPRILGDVSVSDADVAWLERKRRETERANFHDWFLKSVDVSDPLHAKWAREQMPDVWQMRLAEIDRDAEIQKQLAKMSLQGGPNSMEDWMLLYQINKGDVAIPSGPLWDPSRPQNNEESFRRGLFNPKRYAKPVPTVNAERLGALKQYISPPPGSGPAGKFGAESRGGLAGHGSDAGLLNAILGRGNIGA